MGWGGGCQVTHKRITQVFKTWHYFYFYFQKEIAAVMRKLPKPLLIDSVKLSLADTISPSVCVNLNLIST